jgi:hypothetical protein
MIVTDRKSLEHTNNNLPDFNAELVFVSTVSVAVEPDGSTPLIPENAIEHDLSSIHHLPYSWPMPMRSILISYSNSPDFQMADFKQVT